MYKPPSVTPSLMATSHLFSLFLWWWCQQLLLVRNFKEADACNRQAMTLDSTPLFCGLYIQSYYSSVMKFSWKKFSQKKIRIKWRGHFKTKQLILSSQSVLFYIKNNLVSWCFEVSQPLGITEVLKTNFNPSLGYSAHKSFNTSHNISTA